MKIIYWSSKKYGQLEIMVDHDEYEHLIRFHWGVDGKGYVKARNVLVNNPRKYVSLHRYVLGIDDPRTHIDHIDGNPLNNQRSNLRIASIAENCRNRGVPRNNTTGFKGVTKVKRAKGIMYQVNFYVREWSKRKHIFTGTYKTPEEAAIKYNELAKKYHEDFAYQNPV